MAVVVLVLLETVVCVDKGLDGIVVLVVVVVVDKE